MKLDLETSKKIELIFIWWHRKESLMSLLEYKSEKLKKNNFIS